MVSTTYLTKGIQLQLLPSGRPKPKYLLREDVRLILDSVKNPRHKLFIEVLWKTGVRVSEALSLKPESFRYVDLNTGALLTVKTLKRRKVKQNGPGRPKWSLVEVVRIMPVPTDLVNEIFSFVSHQVAIGKPIAANDRLFPFTRQAAHKIIRTAFHRAWQLHTNELSIQDYHKWMAHAHPHVLRHSFAINCIRCGVPLRVLQLWLGHKDLRSTAIYTEVLGEHTTDIMKTVEW